MAEKKIDEVSGVETTGHEWDGIKELNNPLPRWWLWTFYATIVWAIGYMIVYPAIPLATEATKGIWNYSSRKAVSEELAMAQADRAERARARRCPRSRWWASGRSGSIATRSCRSKTGSTRETGTAGAA